MLSTVIVSNMIVLHVGSLPQGMDTGSCFNTTGRLPQYVVITTTRINSTRMCIYLLVGSVNRAMVILPGLCKEQSGTPWSANDNSATIEFLLADRLTTLLV
jgi:hypothetical protein